MRFKLSQLPLAVALRESLAQGYHWRDLWADMAAGLTICILAIPMTMAVAIACGVQPEHGLYGAIIAGPVIALLGGARLSVSGPVAELAVLVYPVVHQFGLGGLMIVTWMAGLMLLIMGIGKLGRIIEFIPYPVTTGFIAGTGVVIFALQIKDFFGITLGAQPKYFLERVNVLVSAFSGLQIGDTIIGSATLFILLIWSRIKTPIPGHLVAMITATLLGMGLPLLFPDIQIDTIGTRYAGVPQSFPEFSTLWLTLDLDSIHSLFGSAFAIAMLCAIKALLCAVVLDGMGGTKHNPNAELIAHGIGNLILPFFGGLTSTSALSRSVANLRVGARSPLASVVHGVSILAVILLVAPILSYLPMAGLGALLLMAAWNIMDFRHCIQIIRIGTRSDVAVLLICFGLTVLLDMVVAVGVGMVLAALLFMKKMAKITGGRWLLHSSHADIQEPLPAGVMVYEISGPLFFGAAEKAMSTLREHSMGLKAIILHMAAVPTIDISGIVALKSALESLYKKQIFVVLSAIQEQPQESLQRAGLNPEEGKLAISKNLSEGLEVIRNRKNLLN
jgi:SulP family sulfate permease